MSNWKRLSCRNVDLAKLQGCISKNAYFLNGRKVLKGFGKTVEFCLVEYGLDSGKFLFELQYKEVDFLALTKKFSPVPSDAILALYDNGCGFPRRSWHIVDVQNKDTLVKENGRVFFTYEHGFTSQSIDRFYVAELVASTHGEYIALAALFPKIRTTNDAEQARLAGSVLWNNPYLTKRNESKRRDAVSDIEMARERWALKRAEFDKLCEEAANAMNELQDTFGIEISLDGGEQ